MLFTEKDDYTFRREININDAFLHEYNAFGYIKKRTFPKFSIESE